MQDINPLLELPTLILNEPAFDGIRLRFRFDNNWEVSVIRHEYSWGGSQGLFEIAVIPPAGFKQTSRHQSRRWLKLKLDGVISHQSTKDVLEVIRKVGNISSGMYIRKIKT
jgi:hypothetical protein